MKTKDLGSGQKVFINVVESADAGVQSGPVAVPGPASRDRPSLDLSGSGQGGDVSLNFSIPYVLGPPRLDEDKGGEVCVVYDAIFHPDTLRAADSDKRMRLLAIRTAIGAVSQQYQLNLSPEFKLPKLLIKVPKPPPAPQTPAAHAAPPAVLPKEARMNEKREDPVEETVSANASAGKSEKVAATEKVQLKEKTTTKKQMGVLKASKKRNEPVPRDPLADDDDFEENTDSASKLAASLQNVALVPTDPLEDLATFERNRFEEIDD